MLSPERLAEIRDQLDRRVLDSIIVKTLLSKAIEEQNITVKDEEVDKVIKQLEDALPADVKFEEYLENIGLAENDLRQSLSKNLRIKKLLEQQVIDIAAVTDEEIKTFYSGNPDKFQVPENIEVRHILIAVKPDDDNAAKAEKMKKAEKIRQQLVDKKGENFEAIAAEVSDCPSKEKGGKLGALVRGQAVKAFEDAAGTGPQGSHEGFVFQGEGAYLKSSYCTKERESCQRIYRFSQS
jgi:peptidyl-prolyl cis-trans isomerase C